MDNLAASLLPLVVGPLLAAVIALIFGSVGMTGKTRRLDYYAKRVELLSKLLAVPDLDFLPNSADVRRVLREELRDVVAYARASSIRRQELAHLAFDDLPWSERIRPPHSPTIGGRLGIFLFYFYGFGALLYLGMLPMQRIDSDFETSPDAAITGAVGCALLAIIGRAWAIASARNSALLSRAAIVIALRPEEDARGMSSSRTSNLRRRLRFLAQRRRTNE